MSVGDQQQSQDEPLASTGYGHLGVGYTLVAATVEDAMNSTSLYVSLSFITED